MSAATQYSDDTSWKKLLLVPTTLHSNTVSSVTSKDRKGRVSSSTRFLLQKSWSLLTLQYFFLSQAKKKYQPSKTEDQRLRPTAKLTRAGETSRAGRAASSSLASTSHSGTTLLKLSSKFPPKYS